MSHGTAEAPDKFEDEQMDKRSILSGKCDPTAFPGEDFEAPGSIAVSHFAECDVSGIAQTSFSIRARLNE